MLHRSRPSAKLQFTPRVMLLGMAMGAIGCAAVTPKEGGIDGHVVSIDAAERSSLGPEEVVITIRTEQGEKREFLLPVQSLPPENIIGQKITTVKYACIRHFGFATCGGNRPQFQPAGYSAAGLRP